MPAVAKALGARRLAGWGLRAAVAAVFLWQCGRLTDPALLRPSDFVEYWSAGRLNLAGANPYGEEELFALQRDYGCPDDRPVMMYNPPWALPFVMPLGALGYGTARLVWLLLHFGLVLVCAGAAWRLLGGAPERRWLAWGLALTFFPTLIALRMGQVAPLMLAGLVGFLYFLRRGWDWSAGVALLPALVKPQLFHLVGLVLVLWAVRERRWAVLGGAAAGLGVATALALAPNPHVLAQYADLMTHHPPAECLSPTSGAVLRLAFGRERFWLQFVPPLMGVAWLVPYWLRHRRTWDWQEQLPLLLLVSLLTTSYGAWAFDLVVLLLPVLRTASALCAAGRRRTALAALTAYLALNALALAMNLLGVDGFWFLWLTPALLAGYWALTPGRAGGSIPLMKRMSLRRFGDIVARVMETLPESLKGHLDNVVVDVEEEPDVATLRRLDFTEEEIAAGETLYGLFDPLPLPDTSGMAFDEPPHRIIIYKRPLEEDFPDRRDLLNEIRKTVVHELAHHFGYTDRDLEKWTDVY